MSRNGVRKDFGVFLAGALVGGAAVMFMTPYSGRKMRRMVRHKVEDAADLIAEAADDLKTQCGELYARGGRMAAGLEKMVARSVTR